MKRSYSQKALNGSDPRTKGLLGIPFDVVLSAFSFLQLELSHWISLVLVCRTWASQSFNTRWMGMLRPVCNLLESIQYIASLPALQYLNVSQVHLTRDDTKLLAGMTTLRELVISDAASVEPLTALTNLETVTCRAAAAEFLPICSCLSKLKSLQLSTIDNETFPSLPTSLTMLGGAYCWLLTCISVDLTKFTQLRTLLLNNSLIDDEGVKSLVCLNLTKLRLERAKVTKKGLAVLNHMTSLRMLDVAHNPISDLSVISSLSLLEVLSLRGSTIANDGLQLSSFTSLRTLILSQTSISNIDSASVLINLTRLSLSQTEVDAQGLVALSPLLRLEYLDLSCCKISANWGTIHASLLSSLHYLILAGCGMSDRDITSLSVLTRLRHLDLFNCKFTDTGLLSLTMLNNLHTMIVGKSVSHQVKNAFRKDVIVEKFRRF